MTTATPKISAHATRLREHLPEDALREFFNKVWTEVLVPVCKAHADERDQASFVFHQMAMDYPATEWRFQGALGFGGKFRTRSDLSCSVDFYPEDRTPAREEIQAEANEKLRQMSAAARASASTNISG